MNENIVELRKVLFETLRGLTDKNNPMDIDRARAISEVAQTMINSAKVEVDFIKATEGNGSGFLEAPKVAHEKGVTSITHECRRSSR